MVGKGRVTPQTPQTDLIVVEAVIVLLRRRQDHVVAGGVGLDHRTALLLPPAGPAHHLRQQAEGALRRPVVIHVQRQIRRQHAHQRHPGEIQSLGHHLSPQQNGDAAALELPQELLVALSHGIGIHPQKLRTGKEPGQLLLHLLCTKADMLHGAAAVGTGIRRRLGVAAVVAHHPPVGGMVGEVDAAPGTLGNVAALGTQQLAAAAPAVQKQDTLLPRRQIPLQLLLKRAADTAEIAVPQLPAHIRQNDLRQTALIEALRQAAEAVIPLAGVIGRLHRGGGGAQHQTGSLLYAAVFGNIPCVVARGFFRFVGALLLLVQYNEAQPFQRGEHRRAGPQHHRSLAPADALILIPPLRQPQAAVQQRHLSAEVGGEPSHHLRGQGDLRHQDHHGLSLLQQGLCQTDIHQRLAAAGDAL